MFTVTVIFDIFYGIMEINLYLNWIELIVFRALMDAGIAEPLLQLLQVKTDQGTMAEAAWTLTYLTAG